jgi:hypothetical protein
MKIKKKEKEMKVPRANISAESTIENTWTIHSMGPLISRPPLEDRMKFSPLERLYSPDLNLESPL